MAVEPIVGPRVEGKGHRPRPSCLVAGRTSHRQIRPSRPGESEIQTQSSQWQIPEGDGCWRCGSLELGEICMFIILILRVALNNPAGAVISLQCVPGVQRRGGIGPGWLLTPGFLKGHDRWASAGHHPVTPCTVIGFQRRTGFVNGASLLLAAFKWTLLGRVANPGPHECRASPVGGEQARGDPHPLPWP